MSEYDEFVGRLRGLIIGLQDVLTSEECSEVEHLIEHDEPGEALRTLAWIIVDEDKRIPRAALTTIEELSRGLVSRKDMPTGLSQHVTD